MPNWSYASRILVHSLRTLVTNFKECLKPKLFWRAVFKYCRARLRMMKFSNGETQCGRGYEKIGAKVAYEISYGSAASSVEQDCNIDLRGPFSLLLLFNLEHMHALLTPLVMRRRGEEHGRGLPRRTERATIRTTNTYYVIMYTSTVSLRKIDVPCAIYSRTDLSDAQKRARASAPLLCSENAWIFKSHPIATIRRLVCRVHKNNTE